LITKIAATGLKSIPFIGLMTRRNGSNMGFTILATPIRNGRSAGTNKDKSTCPKTRRTADLKKILIKDKINSTSPRL